MHHWFWSFLETPNHIRGRPLQRVTPGDISLATPAIILMDLSPTDGIFPYYSRLNSTDCRLLRRRSVRTKWQMKAKVSKFFDRFITYSVKRRGTADDEGKKKLHREKESVRERSGVIHVTRAPKDKTEGDKEITPHTQVCFRSFLENHFHRGLIKRWKVLRLILVITIKVCKKNDQQARKSKTDRSQDINTRC